MTLLTATSKGVATRDAIVARAFEQARAGGLESLSIGVLAQAVGMSKSGVFAHFGSKQDLQLAVLADAAEQFAASVLRPALAQPRGLPRLRALMQAWFDWGRRDDGGCVLLASVAEYDDRPGAIRDQVRENEARWRVELQRALRIAIDCGHLRDGDVEQYAFELYAMPLMAHHTSGLFGYAAARAHGEAAFERWIAANSP